MEEGMQEVKFSVSTDEMDQLKKLAVADERTPEKQAKVLLLEAMGLRQKQAIAKVPSAARGSRNKSSNGTAPVERAEMRA
jgi:hypothetical protein